MTEPEYLALRRVIHPNIHDAPKQDQPFLERLSKTLCDADIKSGDTWDLFENKFPPVIKT